MTHKSMLFVRRYKQFQGGHLKLVDYIGHAAAIGWIDPVLHVTEDSDAAALGKMVPQGVRRTDLPCETDLVFVAGMDWRILDDAGQKVGGTPPINFIQGLRHADPANPVHAYLSRPAVRICVSHEVSEAITASGRVNGPVVTIENGIDVTALSRLARAGGNGRILVDGIKNRDLAKQVSLHLGVTSTPHDILTSKIPRAEYLNLVSRYSVLICLPLPEEGFYLPALEAMAMNVAVVVPDCIGNRGFCIDGTTCLMPRYDVKSLSDAAADLLLDASTRSNLVSSAAQMAQAHSIERERKAFHTFLETHFT